MKGTNWNKALHHRECDQSARRFASADLGNGANRAGVLVVNVLKMYSATKQESNIFLNHFLWAFLANREVIHMRAGFHVP